MNTVLFKFYVARAGLTLAKVADILGINVSTLHRKIKGTTDFTRSEVLLIRECLKLNPAETDQIFFSQQFAEMQKREAQNKRSINFNER